MNTPLPRPNHWALIFSCLLFASYISSPVLADPLVESAASETETAPDAPAEEAGDRVAQIVITPNRYATRIEEVGSSITVIDSEEIELKRQPSVLEVLRTVPGLEVVQISGRGRQTSIFMRGAGASQTLVLIDGVRANTNTDGTFDFSDLQADNIERIEVLRGPQSVLYGSEAIGGVINIITKSGAQGFAAVASAEGGSHGTNHEKIQGSFGSELANGNSWDGTLSADYFNTDGISAAQSKNGNGERDGNENFNSSGRVGLSFADDGRTDLTFRQTHADTELDTFEFGVGPVDALNFTQKRDTFTSSWKVVKPITDWLTPSVQLGYVDEDLKGSDSDTSFNNYDIDNKLFESTAQFDLVPIDPVVLSLGYHYEDRDGENKGNFDEHSDINSFFILSQYNPLEWLNLTAGVRNDDHSDFGNETTYRFTVSALESKTETRLHSSYGTGFKAPTFNDLYFPNFGNPNLDAETSWGYDVGIEQMLCEKSIVLDGTFFYNKFDDLIGFDDQTFTAINVNEAKAYGFESSLRWDANKELTLAFNYTYTDSEDESTGRILPRRSRHRGTANLYFSPWEKLDGALTFILVNSRRDSTGEKMDNYQRVDLSLSYRVSENIRPFVRAENIFDEDYEEVPGFGTPGVEVFGGLEVRM